MPSVSLQRMPRKFQEKSSDLEALLLELGFLCEKNAVGQTTASFSYNAHGSTASMPHLSAMDWDFAEKLCHVTRGTTEAYYNYDGSGIRTRKVVEKNGVVETRLYLGGFEIWRKTVNGTLETERETLHVMDDQRRIALVETLTVENGNAVANPVPVLRFQLDNHLGSASLELDDSANIISYEEYYPYGDTSYRAGHNASEVSRKRYRYTGKEKDEESGLYYHGARYYACWLGRWTAADPIGIGDGLNVYMYVRGNPVKLQDPNGTESEELRYKYEAFPKPDDVDNSPLVVPNVKKTAAKSKNVSQKPVANNDKSIALPNVNIVGDGGSTAEILDHVFDISSSSTGMSSASGNDTGPTWEWIKQIETTKSEKLSIENIYENLYKGGKLPKAGDRPSDFNHLLGRDEYYLARKIDYELRHPGQKAPDYYEEYGNKYLHKFKYDTYGSLSLDGQKWLKRTLYNLQDAIEKEVSKTRGGVEKNSESFRTFAFGSHPNAYTEAGLLSLPIQDLLTIAFTPYFEDSFFNKDGRVQIAKVVDKCLSKKFSCFVPIMKKTVERLLP